MLNCVFVVLLFSGGIPILLPIACVTFGVAFWVNKILCTCTPLLAMLNNEHALSITRRPCPRTTVLKASQRPPYINAAIPRAVIALVPWALVLHTMITATMYSHEEVLEAPVRDGWQGVMEDTWSVARVVARTSVDKELILGLVRAAGRVY